jgi:hypothetical protein
MITSFLRKHFDLLLMTGLYTLSFGLSLLNFGVFWDDWVYVGQPLSILVRNGSELAIPWLGYFQYLFTGSIYGIVMCRLLVFSCFLLSGFCLFYVIKSIRQIPPLFRLLICVFFLIFPIHYGRMLICVSHYALCFFTFFLALAVTALYLKKRSFILRFLALSLFFFSFFTNSLLVFYLVAILLIFYHDPEKSLGRFIAKYFDFFALPILFFLARNFWFPPHGLFDGYNQFSLKSIGYSLIYLPLSFKTSFFDVIAMSLTQISIVYLLLFGAAIYYILNPHHDQFEWKGRSRPFIFLGFFLFLLGVSPYILVGKPPLLIGWESRHQLLLGLGGAMLLTSCLFGIRHFFKLSSHHFIFISSLMIGSFVVFNIHTQLDYHRDWAKQDALTYQLQNTPEIGQARTVVFDDRTIDLNAFSRRYSFYEYTHLMVAAYGGHHRLGLDIAQLAVLPKFILRRDYPEYGFKEWTKTSPQLLVTILPATPLPSSWQLVGDRLLFKDRYLRKISASLKLSTQDL